MDLPRSLDDLVQWRKPLLAAPEGSLSRQYGQRLQELQEARASGQIDHPTFQKRATDIVTDLAEHENELPYWDHHLANADIGLQYQRFSEQADRAAGRSPADLAMAFRNEMLDRLAPRSSAQAEDSDDEEEPPTSLNNRLTAMAAVMRNIDAGSSPEQAVTSAARDHDIRHRQDLSALISVLTDHH